MYFRQECPVPPPPPKMKQDLILPDGFNVSNLYIKPFDISKRKLNYKKKKK